MTELSDNSDRVPGRVSGQPYRDIYLERACGKALCQLYEVEGIQLLISSLSFPSIDAFYNYDRNVPNYISAYAGFDLPDTERYDQAHWQKWFDTHKDSIDIKASADAFRAYTAMTDSVRGEPDSVQLPRYEAFLTRFPNHTRARAELAGKLNALAWTMATTPASGNGDSPALRAPGGQSRVSAAVAYAQRAVELAPDANNYDTLIEALVAAGRYEDAVRTTQEALRKHPNEPMLKTRLRALLKE
jgi:tetratricopeptide (TPR) repeat protein